MKIQSLIGSTTQKIFTFAKNINEIIRVNVLNYVTKKVFYFGSA